MRTFIERLERRAIEGPTTVRHPAARLHVVFAHGATPATPAIAAAAKESAAATVAEYVGQSNVLAAIEIPRFVVSSMATAFKDDRVDPGLLETQRQRNSRYAAANHTHL